MMDSLIYPRNIAIIGASNNIEKVGGILVKKAKQSKVNIIPINPSSNVIQGIKAYKSVLKYKQIIDLAVIAIPSEHVKNAVIECCKKRIKYIIIISAGFSELGNSEEEKEIIEIANKHKTRILGPNCFGIANPYLDLDLTFSKTSVKKGKIAFISQSGALWSYISDLCSDKLGFSVFASLGNMADLAFTDLIKLLTKDKNTKSIVLYVEKLKDGKAFINECKKCKKPIYVVKVGSSKEGSSAAISHTGSLASDYEIYKGAFKQARIGLCDTLEEALEKASKKPIISKKKKESISKISNKVFIITNAGGAGALESDYLSNSKHELIKSPRINNPLDILGTAQAKDYQQALDHSSILDYDFLIITITLQSMTNHHAIINEIIKYKHAKNRNIIVLLLGNKSVKHELKLLKSHDIQCFNTLKEFKDSL